MPLIDTSFMGSIRSEEYGFPPFKLKVVSRLLGWLIGWLAVQLGGWLGAPRGLWWQYIVGNSTSWGSPSIVCSATSERRKSARTV